MLDKEIHIRFTLASVRRFFLSPLFWVPFVVLVLVVPWGNEHAPAWVQAVGSVLAIVVAVAVAFHSHEQDLQRRQEDADATDHAHATRLYMLVGEAILAAESLLNRTRKKMESDLIAEPLRIPGVESEDDRQWFAVQRADVEFFQRIMQRAMLNLDDDLNARRHIIAAKHRFNLSVLITFLSVRVGTNPTPHLEGKIEKALEEFRRDKEKLVEYFPRLDGLGFQ